MDDEALGRAFAEVSRRRRLATGGDVVEIDGLFLLFHPEPDDEVNYAVVGYGPADPAAALEEARRLFAARGRRFGLDLQRGRHPALEEAIRVADLRLLFDRPLMTASPGSIAAVSPPAGCDVVRAGSPEDLDALAAIDAEVFETSFAVSRSHYAEALLTMPEAEVLAAREDGRAVGAAIAFTAEGTVGVFGVAVLPEARGRGIGAALTAAAAHAVPGEAVWLQPSDLARPLYERLGFGAGPTFEVWAAP